MQSACIVSFPEPGTHFSPHWIGSRVRFLNKIFKPRRFLHTLVFSPKCSSDHHLHRNGSTRRWEWCMLHRQPQRAPCLCSSVLCGGGSASHILSRGGMGPICRASSRCIGYRRRRRGCGFDAILPRRRAPGVAQANLVTHWTVCRRNLLQYNSVSGGLPSLESIPRPFHGSPVKLLYYQTIN